MRSDLSFENLTAVLAALGASALVACGGATPPPVDAHEVAPAATTQASGNASCSAKGCGATPAAATSPSTAAASSTTDSPTAAAATPTPDPAAAAATAAPAPTAAPATVAKKPAAKSGATAAKPKPKATSGEASCGAGTCGSDPKKKLL